jgi:hypothetical protein
MLWWCGGSWLVTPLTSTSQPSVHTENVKYDLQCAEVLLQKFNNGTWRNHPGFIDTDWQDMQSFSL